MNKLVDTYEHFIIYYISNIFYHNKCSAYFHR